MLPVWLRDVFQTGSLLLGIRMLSAIQWGPSLHLVPISAHSSGQLFFLGSSSAAWEQPWFCSWLSGDSELPSTWKYQYTSLPVPCSALSALFNLPVAVGCYSFLKVSWPHQNFFLKQVREHSQSFPSSGRTEAVGTNTNGVTGSWNGTAVCKVIFSVYICAY